MNAEQINTKIDPLIFISFSSCYEFELVMFLSCNYPLKLYLNFVVGLNIAASESFFSYIFLTFTDFQ